VKLCEPTPAALQEAAGMIAAGGLVVVPTETVYGLAANALNEMAVQKIFDAKGRPNDNPLIVHIADEAELQTLASADPEVRQRLSERFWPGPLTLVLPKSPQVPDITTGGLDTVAVRMPAHEVPRRIARLSGCSLAAPSANVFMGLSPTRVEDLDPALFPFIDMIIDGGPCQIGIESTVLDLSESPPRLLRPGGISRSDMEVVIGTLNGDGGGEKRSPGMYPRHYAPAARVVLVERASIGSAALVFSTPSTRQIQMPSSADEYAAALYAALHQLDKLKPEAIQVEIPPNGEEWEGVWDRLKKAAATL
jgi:L-threonylcarbamoyladenylate synthase